MAEPRTIRGLHKRLLFYAITSKTENWHRASKESWQKAFIAKTREVPAWDGEFDPTRTMTDEELAQEDMTRPGPEDSRSEMDEIIHDETYPTPDAWRLVVEGEATEGREWNYDVLILEFLEIEVGHELKPTTLSAYSDLWVAFDATDHFHFRLYRMNILGEVTCYLE